MSSNYQRVLQAALQLPPDERLRLREAREDRESALVGSSEPARIPGLNHHDPQVLEKTEFTNNSSHPDKD